MKKYYSTILLALLCCPLAVFLPAQQNKMAQGEIGFVKIVSETGFRSFNRLLQKKNWGMNTFVYATKQQGLKISQNKTAPLFGIAQISMLESWHVQLRNPSGRTTATIAKMQFLFMVHDVANQQEILRERFVIYAGKRQKIEATEPLLDLCKQAFQEAILLTAKKIAQAAGTTTKIESKELDEEQFVKEKMGDRSGQVIVSDRTPLDFTQIDIGDFGDEEETDTEVAPPTDKTKQPKQPKQPAVVATEKDLEFGDDPQETQTTEPVKPKTSKTPKTPVVEVTEKDLEFGKDEKSTDNTTTTPATGPIFKVVLVFNSPEKMEKSFAAIKSLKAALPIRNFKRINDRNIAMTVSYSKAAWELEDLLKETFKKFNLKLTVQAKGKKEIQITE